MEYKRTTYTSSESDAARKKAQDAIDHAREVREQKIVNGKKRVVSEPHLIADGKLRAARFADTRFKQTRNRL